MPVEVTGTPVEMTGVAIDIVATAPGIERTASRVCFEGTAHPERTRRNSPPVVAARPLKKKKTRLAATPTPVYHDPDWPSVSMCLSMVSMLMLGIIHLLMLGLYYDDEWSKAYCEKTGLAAWVLGIASAGLGSFPHQFLVGVSIYVCKCRKDNLVVPLLILIVLSQLCWFCSGQSARPRVDLARPPTQPHTPTHSDTHTRAPGRLILRSHSPRRRHGLGNRQLRLHHVRQHHERRVAGLCDRERWARNVRP